MTVSPYSAMNPTETNISFPKLECWNPATKVASIAASVNKKRVLCSISFKLLQDRFGALPEEPMQAVAANRATLQAAAQRVIESETYEEDGSVVIRAEDL